MTSVARIEPETSTSRMIVACSSDVLMRACGLATAVAAVVSASRSNASGTQRFHVRRVSTTPASTSMFVKAIG